MTSRELLRGAAGDERTAAGRRRHRRGVPGLRPRRDHGGRCGQPRLRTARRSWPDRSGDDRCRPAPWRGRDGRAPPASFTFDVDAESAVLWGSPQNADRMSVISHQAYGPLVGVPRLLRPCSSGTGSAPPSSSPATPRTATRTSCATSSRPGHEIAHHGYLHEQPTGVDAQAARPTILDRGLAALEEVAGVRPVGYRAPMWDLSWRSPRLLAERGFLYDSSLMDADAPYELAVAAGSATSIVEIPIQWALDDWEQYCYLPDISGAGLIETPRKAARAVAGRVRGAAVGRVAAGCSPTTRSCPAGPARAQQLDELMAHVVACADVWTASLEEIAVHVRGLRLAPRVGRVPRRTALSRSAAAARARARRAIGPAEGTTAVGHRRGSPLRTVQRAGGQHEGRDLVGRRVSVVLHRQAALRGGAGALRPSGRGGPRVEELRAGPRRGVERRRPRRRRLGLRPTGSPSSTAPPGPRRRRCSTR